MLNHRCVIPEILLILLCGRGLDVQARDAAVPHGHATTEQDLVDLKARHEKRRQAFGKAIIAATTLEEKDRVAEDFQEYWFDAIDGMSRIAQRQPSSNVGMQAALWVMRYSDGDYQPSLDAAKILLVHHPRAEKLGTIYDKYGFHPVYEKLLRVGARSNVSETSRALAIFALADLLVYRADFKDRMQVSPQMRPEPVIAEYFQSTDRDEDRLEAKRLLKKIQSEFPEVAYRARTLGEAAAERLLRLEQSYLEIGKVAPSIVGRDLSGNRLALEDHRGKVVVISFWASWCGPCLSRVPEENQLLDHFQDEPFILLGVNGDESLKDAIRAAQDHGIRFTSWWDDPAAENHIVDRYAVSAWPTIFVVDQQGVISNKNLFGPDLREAVDHLLKKGIATTRNGVPSHAPEPVLTDGRVNAP